MTPEFPLPDRRFKNPARPMQQGVWLLVVIALALLLIVRRSASARSGWLWILGGAVASFVLLLAARDMMRKVGRRYTEDKIVKDVKTFLERQPAIVVDPPKPIAPAAAAQLRDEEPRVPLPATNFVPVTGTSSTPYGRACLFPGGWSYIPCWRPSSPAKGCEPAAVTHVRGRQPASWTGQPSSFCLYPPDRPAGIGAPH